VARHHGVSLSASTRLSQAEQVAEWVAQSGGEYNGVQVAINDGLTLVASKDARSGDELLQVPLSLGLTAESVLRSSIGVYLVDFEPELADYAFIALALLHERRLVDQSELEPWLSATALLPPNGFSDLPLLWSSGERAALDAATTAGAASRAASVKADYDWLVDNVFDTSPVFFPTTVFSEKAYTAAVALALSRCVVVASANDELTPMLLPLLDLPNHASSASATVQSRAAKAAGLFGGGSPACAVLVASRDMQAGEELSLRYGGDTAGELLLDHGFLEEPVAAIASFSFALNEDDNFWDEKMDILEEHAGLAQEGSWLLGEDVPPSAELLAFLRLKNLGAADCEDDTGSPPATLLAP